MDRIGILTLGIALFAVTNVAAGEKRKETPVELRGVWIQRSPILNGKHESACRRHVDVTLEFINGEMTWTMRGADEEPAIFTSTTWIDSANPSKHFEIHYLAFSGATLGIAHFERPMVARYELTDNTLTIRWERETAEDADSNAESKTIFSRKLPITSKHAVKVKPYSRRRHVLLCLGRRFRR